jgi:hypothetical protein
MYNTTFLNIVLLFGMVLGCFGSNKWTEVAVNPAQPAKDSKFKIFYFSEFYP